MRRRWNWYQAAPKAKAATGSWWVGKTDREFTDTLSQEVDRMRTQPAVAGVAHYTGAVEARDAVFAGGAGSRAYSRK